MWTFTPNKKQATLNVPYIEDARQDFAPYYSVSGHGKGINDALNALSAEFGKLDALITNVEDGVFTVNGQERHGYNIHFIMGGVPGVIRAAGLPIRKHTQVRETAVRVQCLLIIRDWLKAAVTARVFNPYSHPLIPHLLLPDGVTTIAEHINQAGTLPMLTDGRP
jgi:hypothetical protein